MAIKKYARGSGIESKGKTKGKMVKMADGGVARPVDTGLARAAAMSGRTMPATGRPAMKKGGSVKKYADGGMTRPAVMPGRSGAVPTGRPAVAPGRPEATGLARAAQMSGRTMPTTGRPAMKKGGSVKKYARGGGIESRGKTRGKFV